MTCIVGIETTEGTYLLADSLGSAGWDCTHRRDGKLHELRAAQPGVAGIALGFTSSYRMGQALGYGLRSWAADVVAPAPADRHEWMVLTFVPKVRELLDDAGALRTKEGVETGGTFLVAIGGTLFEVSDDLQVGSFEDGYGAVGCGEPYAIGALHARLDSVGKVERRDPDVRFAAAQAAMRAAFRYSNGVGGRVDALTVGEVR